MIGNSRNGKMVRARIEIDLVGKNGSETPSGDFNFYFLFFLRSPCTINISYYTAHKSISIFNQQTSHGLG
jgi:hypothetical protein